MRAALLRPPTLHTDFDFTVEFDCADYGFET
jgi:hypothetical protein